jgi:hypothetical protein
MLIAKHNYNDQVKDDEMGRTYSIHTEEDKCYRVLVRKAEEKMI